MAIGIIIGARVRKNRHLDGERHHHAARLNRHSERQQLRGMEMDSHPRNRNRERHKTARVIDIPYGLFLSDVVSFLIVAMVLFFVIKKFLGFIVNQKKKLPFRPPRRHLRRLPPKKSFDGNSRSAETAGRSGNKIFNAHIKNRAVTVRFSFWILQKTYFFSFADTPSRSWKESSPGKNPARPSPSTLSREKDPRSGEAGSPGRRSTMR